MSRPPFFIVGSDRSGTTLLRLMLNEHSELHVPRESWFIIDLLNALPIDRSLTETEKAHAVQVIVSNERWKDLEISEADLAKEVDSLNSPSLRDLIDAVFRISTRRAGKHRWGDKTPDYVKEIQRIHTLFPEAKFLHIIRDARDVCLSLLRIRWLGTWVPNIARYWVEYVNAGIESGRRLSPDLYKEVRYEALVLDTEGVLRDICLFLGVEYEQGMQKFYESAQKNIAPWEQRLHQKTLRPPSHDDVGRWKHEAGPLFVAMVEAIAGPTMARVDQPRRYSHFHTILPSLLQIVETTLRAISRMRKRLLRS